MFLTQTDLHSSRWARPTARATSGHYTTSTPPSAIPANKGPAASSRLEELAKCDRLLRRLRWKAQMLLYSFDRASALITEQQREGPDAETMFKIDFFEFFVLLERTLVHLLASLQISIPRGDTNNKSHPIFGTAGRIPIYSHRYHANLLEALDRPSNPIHSALGIGDVRMYLGVAKECRNKWKVLQPEASEQDGGEDLYTMSSLNMHRMLPAILDGFEQAREIAASVVHSAPQDQTVIYYTQDGYMDMDVQEAVWEAVPDAMEWE